jgi:hypothetical protein
VIEMHLKKSLIFTVLMNKIILRVTETVVLMKIAAAMIWMRVLSVIASQACTIWHWNANPLSALIL